MVLTTYTFSSWMVSQFFSCIILVCLKVMVNAEYTVEVRTLNFSNPGSLLANGACCDYNLTAGDGSCAIPGCDNYFYYCLRALGSTGRGCNGGKVSMIGYNDHPINFSRPMFLGVPNPLPLPGRTETWHGIQLIVQVYEYDQSKTPELVLEGTHDIGFDSVSLSEESEMVLFANGNHTDRASIVLSFKVTCGESNFGLDCSQSCNDSLCGQNSLCVPGVSNYSCICAPGYSGENCEIDINECTSFTNPCNGRGQCVDAINGYSCVCDAGFTGIDCELNIDDCVGVNCTENAQCVDEINNYMCVCDPGFTGEKCDIDINECETMDVNCTGQGMCKDGINSFSCICYSGFTGSMCEDNINDCLEEVCHGHGQCVDGVNNYVCICRPGYTGAHCDININECDTMNINNCSDRGECLDGVNDFRCICDSGYSGKDCKEDINDCIGIDCSGHGQCIDSLNDYSCTCDPGYTAKNCDTEINECEALSIHCSGHGQCVDGVNSYSCVCDAGFTGQDCEVNINECEKMNLTCGRHGRCMDEINSYTCVCDPGFTGTACSTAVTMDGNPVEEEASQDILQLQVIGGVFIGIVSFGLIVICVLALLITFLAHQRKSLKGVKTNRNGAVRNIYTMTHTRETPSIDHHGNISEHVGGQWEKYDNPLYRDKSTKTQISDSKQSVRQTVNSEPIFDDANYFTVSLHNTTSGSSTGLSNSDRDDSLEHEFDNPIYDHIRQVRFNIVPVVNRISADLQYL